MISSSNSFQLLLPFYLNCSIPIHLVKRLQLAIPWHGADHVEEIEHTLVGVRHDALDVVVLAGGVAVAAEVLATREGGGEGLVGHDIGAGALEG